MTISTRQRRPFLRQLWPWIAILVLLLSGGVARAQAAAVLVYPANGAQNIDTRQLFRWNAVATAQAYRLHIGSTAPEPDAELTPDLFDSGVIGSTSVAVPALPANQMLFARLWTQTSGSGVWSYSDSSFQAVARPATFVYPQNGDLAVDPRLSFTWTAIAGAQGYYFKIGTTVGGNDVVNSGALASDVTSFRVTAALPLGQTLYARISTRLNDRWWYTDITFQPASTPATLTYPLNGADHVDTRRPFVWNGATAALGYALAIGTTPGGQDILASGTLGSLVTSYALPQALPVGVTLYARLSTLFGTTWIGRDISFRAEARPATFTYPLNNTQNVDTRLPVTWTPVAEAQGYYLKIGTAVGAQDLVSSGTIAASVTSFTLKQALPANVTLYARLSTLLDGNWWSNDITFKAVGRPAVFTYPLAGTLKFDPRQPFTWTATADSQGYYLRVGTTPGGQDLINTSTLANTVMSYKPRSPLPPGQPLYARISTKLNNAWWHSDITFQAIPLPATFTYPLDGALKVDARRAFGWTPVAGATGYYLKIGTSPGEKDVFSSGALAGDITSYLVVPRLPPGTTLYARISTLIAGTWWYNDISFQAIPRPAVFTSPVDGAMHFDWRQAVKWTTVTEAEAYYLKIGTTAGGQDLVSSGTLAASATSFTLTKPLPAGQTLYARISTKLDDTWWFNDIAFQAAQPPATFICPTKSQKVDLVTTPFTWTTVPQAQAYKLWIGTTRGTSNLYSSGETSATSLFVPALPVGSVLWARVYTKDAFGNWDYSDVSFLAQGVPVVFTSPAHGSVDVTQTPTLTWTPAAVVNSIPPKYLLTIGTAPGQQDVARINNLTTASYSLTTTLPAGTIIYARVLAFLGDGTRRYGDTVFSTAGVDVPTLALIYPANSGTPTDGDGTPAVPDVDVSRPFAWQGLDMADAYQLQIYAGIGVVDASGQPGIDGLALARDSGPLHVPRVFFCDLPPGAYTGRLGMQLPDGWHWRTFLFNVTRSGADAAQLVEAGLWATNFVRNMADTGNYPYNWSVLPRYMAHWPAATCLDYRETLLAILKEMQVTAQFAPDLQPRRLNIAFRSNQFDTHALTEIYDSAGAKWVIMDPTFALKVTRSADGSYATKEDVQQATLQQRWSDITYTPLGSYGYTVAQNYHIDYPLLYLNVSIPEIGTGQPTLTYLQNMPLPVDRFGAYCVRSGQSPATIVVDGQTGSYDCRALEGIGKIFVGTHLGLAAGSASDVEVYSPRRYVFTGGRW